MGLIMGGLVAPRMGQLPYGGRKLRRVRLPPPPTPGGRPPEPAGKRFPAMAELTDRALAPSHSGDIVRVYPHIIAPDKPPPRTVVGLSRA